MVATAMMRHSSRRPVLRRTDQRIHVGADDQVKDDWLPKPTIPILGQAIALPPHTRGHPTRWTVFQRRLPWPFGTWAADPHRDAKSPRRRSISNAAEAIGAAMIVASALAGICRDRVMKYCECC